MPASDQRDAKLNGAQLFSVVFAFIPRALPSDMFTFDNVPGGGWLRSRPALAVPYLAAYGALNAYLWPRTGKDRVPVLAYSTALLAMSLFAPGRRKTT